MAQTLMFSGYHAEYGSYVCLNVGAALARQGKRILFVELEDLLVSPLSSWVPPVASGIYDMLQGKSCDIAHRAGKTEWDIILPAATGERCYETIDKFLTEWENKPRLKGLLRDTLQPLESRYDYILIDGGDLINYARMAGFEVRLPLVAYNIFIPVLLAFHPDSYSNLGYFMERYKESIHQTCAVEAVVFSQFYPKEPMQRRLINSCRECLAESTDIVTLDYNETMRDAFKIHQDIFEYAPSSKAAMQIETMAWRLMEQSRHTEVTGTTETEIIK